MRKLSVFNNVSADGYFVDSNGDMAWAYQGANDPEWSAFVSGNAGAGGALLFGRITYEMMADYWPTPAAAEAMSAVAAGMNQDRIVVPRAQGTRVAEHGGAQGDLLDAIRALKKTQGEDIVVLGSGSVVAQLAEVGLIDAYQLVVNPSYSAAGARCSTA